jgi:hypothetical protein
MNELPDFQLAPLRALPADTFRSHAPEVDAFVLSLALAFNDFKGLEWFRFQLDKGEPDVFGVNEYCGQYIGMGLHLTRLSLGLVHEVLLAVQKADDNGIPARSEFRAAVELLKPEAASLWRGFVSVAQGRNAPEHSGFLKWLAQVRNNAAYHYYQPKKLLQGYQKYFSQTPTTPHNAHAYVSFGPTMEESRFYFADAAVGASYENVDGMMKAGELKKQINKVLRSVVEAYVLSRNPDMPRPSRRTARSARKRRRSPFRKLR